MMWLTFQFDRFNWGVNIKCRAKQVTKKVEFSINIINWGNIMKQKVQQVIRE